MLVVSSVFAVILVLVIIIVIPRAWCVVRGAWCVVRGAWCVEQVVQPLAYELFNASFISVWNGLYFNETSDLALEGTIPPL